MDTKTAGGLVGPPVSKQNGETVKVKILSGTVADGKRYESGDVAEVSEQAGRILLSMRKAEPYAGTPKKPTARKPKTLKKAK